jgi:hypothetical protein
MEIWVADIKELLKISFNKFGANKLKNFKNFGPF